MSAASLELEPDAIEPFLQRLLWTLEKRLSENALDTLAAWGERDALFDRRVSWDGRSGLAQGVDNAGHLIVALPDGCAAALSAGEVHLESVG